MIRRLFIVALLLALVFGGIFGWKAYQQQQSAARIAGLRPPAVTVSSTAVTTAAWRRTVTAVGSLRAIQGVDVSPEVAGVVAGISFTSGHQVAEGAVLVQLDAAAEEAELRSLEAQLQLARLDYERARGLQVKTALSQAQLDRAKSVLDSLAAQADEQKALIARKTLRAPFGGELGIRQINLGEYLSPGMPIVTLQQLDPIYVDFSLPERYLEALAVDQVLELKLAAYPNERFQGRISAISPRVEERTRNVLLQGTLQNVDRRLRPGMFARIAVLLGEEDQVLTLPRTAISFYPYGDSVFVIEGSGEALTVRRQQVTTGRIQGNSVEILRGLEAGQQVVSAGQLKLRNGQSIRIDNSITPPAGATRG